MSREGQHPSRIGMITAIDQATGSFRLKEGEESFCSICCGQGTEVVSDGCAIPIADLGPGDVIRWEEATVEGGQVRVGKVVLLQAAWQTISSPEW